MWDRILAAVSKAYDGDIQMIDSSSIRVHQHAANGAGMIDVDKIGDIRRAYFEQHRPIKEIVRDGS